MSEIQMLNGRLPLAAGWQAALLSGLLTKLRYGRLVCTTPEGERMDQRGKLPGPTAMLVLHDWRALRALLLGGEEGFADSFLRGEWSSPDLVAFMMLAARNFGEARITGLPSMA